MVAYLCHLVAHLVFFDIWWLSSDITFSLIYIVAHSCHQVFFVIWWLIAFYLIYGGVVVSLHFLWYMVAHFCHLVLFDIWWLSCVVTFSLIYGVSFVSSRFPWYMVSSCYIWYSMSHLCPSVLCNIWWHICVIPFSLIYMETQWCLYVLFDYCGLFVSSGFFTLFYYFIFHLSCICRQKLFFSRGVLLLLYPYHIVLFVFWFRIFANMPI